MEKKTTCNTGLYAGVGTDVARQTYEATVLNRMAGRSGSGSPMGAKGIVNEITFTDLKNLESLGDPKTVTRLTQQANAPQVDVVTMCDGKVAARYQLKDTPSSSAYTLKQVQAGKYQQTQLVGTKESAQSFNTLAEKAGVGKRMDSTGVSSKTTKRIADKFTHTVPDLSNVTHCAKNSAVAGAAVTAAVEAAKSIANGDSLGEFAEHAVPKCAESAVAAGVGAAAGELAAGAAGMALGAGAPVLIPVAVGIAATVAVGTVAGEVVDGLFDDVGEIVGDAVDLVGDMASCAGEIALDTVGDVVSSVADGVSDLFFDISSLFW